MWTSTDAATTWQQGPQLGAAPHAVTATADTGAGLDGVEVVTDEGVLESTDGGRTFTVVLSL